MKRFLITVTAALGLSATAYACPTTPGYLLDGTIKVRITHDERCGLLYNMLDQAFREDPQFAQYIKGDIEMVGISSEDAKLNGRAFVVDVKRQFNNQGFRVLKTEETEQGALTAWTNGERVVIFAGLNDPMNEGAILMLTFEVDTDAFQ